MTKSQSRIRQTAEIFTSSPLVNEILDKLNETNLTIFTDPSKTFLDNSCGNGQFLIEVVATKYEYFLSHGKKSTHTKNKVISTTFGVDIMADNVCDSIARIIFFLEWQIDIFDSKGLPIEGLTEFRGYEKKDGADFNWLEKNHDWERTYTCQQHTVIVRPHKDKWWIMEWSFNGEKWNLYHWIICADALKYHYRFDGTHPHDVNKQERLVDVLVDF